MIRNCSAWFKTVILCKKKSFYSCFPPVPTFFPVCLAVFIIIAKFIITKIIYFLAKEFTKEFS